MKYTETEDVVTIVIDKHNTDDFEGFLGLVKLGLYCNASTYALCDEINSVMNKHAYTKEQIAAHWSSMFIKITGKCIDHIGIRNPVLKELISNLYNQIGEAIGPVSYAGFKLRKYLQENEPDSKTYQDWVDDCIYYYEHSEFVK